MNTKVHILLALLLVTSYSVVLSGQTNTGSESAFKKVNEANKQVISNPTNAFTLAVKAVEISKVNKNKSAEASAYNTLGTLYYNSANYNKAIEYFLLSKNIYAIISDSTNEEYALKYLAKSYEALGKPEVSIGYNNLAEQKASSSDNKSSYRVQNSKIKRKQGKTKEAIDELEDELKNNSKLSTQNKIDIYLELGDLYLADKDTAKGVKLISAALSTSTKAKGGRVTDSITVKTLNSASAIYESNGYGSKNVEVQNFYWNYGNKANKPELEKAALTNLGNSYLKSNDLPNAIQNFEKSAQVKVPQRAGEKQDLEEIKVIEKLSEAYEKAGDYDKALETYKKYIGLVDSIKQSEMTSKLTSELLSAKFEVQESKIKDLEVKQTVKEASIKQQQITIISLSIGLAVLLLLTYFLVKNIRQKQKSNSLIRLASLRSQMNPHFIFNSLNSVNRFISENNEVKANAYLSNFSKLMRSVLNNSDKDSIPLAEELKVLEIYLSLEHSRFDDLFNYELVVDDKLNSLEIEIPPMLIQPYIENAIWHGLRYKETGGFLKIEMSHQKDRLEVVIEDNGIGREESQRLKTSNQKDYTSTGISNTQERIDIINKLNDSNLQVTIEDLKKEEKACGTRVTLQIPIIYAESYV